MELSQKSRSLANLLARDNGRFLYECLLHSAYSAIPDINDRLDLVQDFFIDICQRAETYEGIIDDTIDIRTDVNLHGWLETSFRHHISQFLLRKKRRVDKQYKKERALEFSLTRSSEKKAKQEVEQFEQNVYFQLFLRDRLANAPERDIISYEEEIESQRRREMLTTTVRRGVKSLDEVKRHAIELHYSQGMDVREIARVTGTSVTTVKGRLYEGRKQLKETFSYKAEQVYKRAA